MTSAGTVSGIFEWLFRIRRHRAALLMAAAGVQPQMLRSTMVSVLLWISAYALVCGGALSLASDSVLVGYQSVIWALLLWPAMVVAMHVGSTAFSRSDPQGQARTVVNALMVAAAGGLVTALLRWGA